MVQKEALRKEVNELAPVSREREPFCVKNECGKESSPLVLTQAINISYSTLGHQLRVDMSSAMPAGWTSISGLQPVSLLLRLLRLPPPAVWSAILAPSLSTSTPCRGAKDIEAPRRGAAWTIGIGADEVEVMLCW